jgi:hypothetical protein
VAFHNFRNVLHELNTQVGVVLKHVGKLFNAGNELLFWSHQRRADDSHKLSQHYTAVLGFIKQ